MLKQVLTMALIYGLTACGGHSGGGKKSPHGDTQEDESFLMDAKDLAAVDQNVHNAAQADTAWTVRLEVNGVERANLANAAIAQVSSALEGITLARTDKIRLEVSVFNAANAENLYGTNLESAALANAGTADIWLSQCASRMSPEIDLSTLSLVKDEDGRAKIPVSICDFVGFSLKPLVEIKPQPKLLEKKTVIYKCVFSVNTSTRELWQWSNQSCTYGYATLAGETAPTISILKDYAPGSALFNEHAPVQSKFGLNVGNGGQPHLESQFYKPPFGSNEACQTTKIDVKYADAQGLKTARLTFNRFLDTNGDEIWAPQNPSTWPTLDQMEAYYRQAANEKVTLYRVCEWMPEAEDVASGSVIQFSAP